jgi:uncharacterized protein YndB with AHSA1/START domain
MEIFFLVLLFVVGVFLIYVGRKPDTFRLARTAFIAAPPSSVFPFLNSLKEGSRWSPFEKDPDMKRVYTGPDAGPGARFMWDGNNNVGAGSLEILESVPDQRVVLRLTMLRPMKAVNEVVYDIEGIDGGTEIIWSMSGPQPFLGKVINTIIDCDRMVGRDFEKGLITLKALVEKSQS